MHQIKARVIYNKKIKEGYFKMKLSAPKISEQAKPGQFIHVRVSEKNDPLLRRPFSIHRARPQLEIVYEIKGKGTDILSRRKKGEKIDIIGPLGNGFNYGIRNTEYGRRILVAGGMGVAPLIFLAGKLQSPLVLIGSKNRSKIMCVKGFKNLGCSVKIATEDGSQGFKGLVTNLLREVLRTTNDERRTTVYACGPKPMLAEVAKIAKKHKIPAQVSLEEFMGCGIGACLGCVIKTTRGYKRVCKDGPVFDANEIKWEDR